MRRLAAIAIAVALAFHPVSARASSAWGSPLYGDPPGWCTNYSDMWIGTVVTNDPHVGTNPEQDTFYGFHRNPGYDDWYGFFYGDFRGSPGDSSGWVTLLHENYPNHYHWNFSDSGWAVHGHAKQYIAYHNWTFGGQCGLGAYGKGSPPPYMADQYGYPVVDIYVDSVPPFPPRPYVTEVTPTSVAFIWDPVADRGDGSGQDYFVAGMDRYVSWLTLNGRPTPLQFESTSSPRILKLAGMSSDDTVCVHVVAVDRVQNATADQVACAGPLTPPPMPAWPSPQSRIAANPGPVGLVGLASWLWLTPAPIAITVDEVHRGVHYAITATPVAADWDFGDGGIARFPDASGFGTAYPQPSTVRHVYEEHNQSGYAVRSAIRYAVSWQANVAGNSFGPYPLGTVRLDAQPLVYAVEQAEPVLMQI